MNRVGKKIVYSLDIRLRLMELGGLRLIGFRLLSKNLEHILPSKKALLHRRRKTFEDVENGAVKYKIERRLRD